MRKSLRVLPLTLKQALPSHSDSANLFPSSNVRSGPDERLFALGVQPLRRWRRGGERVRVGRPDELLACGELGDKGDLLTLAGTMVWAVEPA